MPCALLLVVVPLAFAGVCLSLGAPRLRLACLVAGTWAHLGVAVWCWGRESRPIGDHFIGLDSLGQLFVTLMSILFAAASVHFVGYHKGRLISQRVFLACTLALLSTLSLVCVSRNLGLLWVALEASTLSAAPLIYFHLGGRALEATWKFLLMNSVGIAIALIGVFCIELASLLSGPGSSLNIDDLAKHAREFDSAWLRAGFLLALVGFGTKMGLAPMHSWLPDAHGEAPAPISALLSGAVLNGAFLGILRIYQVCISAGIGDFAGSWLVALGLFSMLTAALFIMDQQHFKRLLAYSSVDNMGILAVAVGLGAAGGQAGFLHAMHNVFAKGALFLLAGFLWRLNRTNQVRETRGLLAVNPIAAVLLLGGMCAICGLPPFGMFFSELGIIFAAAQDGRWWVLGLFVLTLSIVFMGFVTAMLPMVFGGPPQPATADREEHSLERWRRGTMLSAAAFLVLATLGLGAYQPPTVRDAITRAAETVFVPPESLTGEPSPNSDRRLGEREDARPPGRMTLAGALTFEGKGSPQAPSKTAASTTPSEENP